MTNSHGNALIAVVLVTACVLVIGGLVAWGAGAFAGEEAPNATTPNGVHGGAMNLPEGHPPIGNMSEMPGAVRPDAPAGACPATGAAANAASDEGCSCCPSEAATKKAVAGDSCCPGEAAAAQEPAGDPCCPKPEAKKACGGEGCSDDGNCSKKESCDDCEGACEKPTEN